jgi:hypothetical protein
MTLDDREWVPLSNITNFGKRKMSHMAQSGEYGTCLSVGVCSQLQTVEPQLICALVHCLWRNQP